jgi:hypothetical protein
MQYLKKQIKGCADSQSGMAGVGVVVVGVASIG